MFYVNKYLEVFEEGGGTPVVYRRGHMKKRMVSAAKITADSIKTNNLFQLRLTISAVLFA